MIYLTQVNLYHAHVAYIIYVSLTLIVYNIIYPRVILSHILFITIIQKYLVCVLINGEKKLSQYVDVSDQVI